MKIKVGKYYLDKEQAKIVLDKSKNLLVVAGAGSGKTLTILGKIKYLIENCGVDARDILCISFTAAASQDLKRKINEDLRLDVDVYTFHKLALNILKGKGNYEIAETSLLDDLIRQYVRIEALKRDETLKPLLKYFKLTKKKDYIKYLEENEKEVENFERLLSTFIHLFKANNYALEDFIKFKRRALWTFDMKRYCLEKSFLTLAVTVYLQYTNYMEENGEIDFDDMLSKAREHVDKYGVFHKVKYVIIDEFQDTSLVRFELIRSILKKTGAALMVVGDDFQSIYRFTGCDLSLFLDFQKILKESKVLKIQNTYRNSQELIEVAGKFVMRNKAQLHKNLRSSKSVAKPIVIENYDYAKRALCACIEEITSHESGDILIIGRNNKDISFFLDKERFKIDDKGKIIYLSNPSLNIRYLTVHKSKGLESDNVILINLTDNILGFPNQMKDEQVLRFVSPYASRFPFDEERRLFYVALTRTKNKVYLLVPKKNPSVFVRELERDYGQYIEKK